MRRIVSGTSEFTGCSFIQPIDWMGFNPVSSCTPTWNIAISGSKSLAAKLPLLRDHQLNEAAGGDRRMSEVKERFGGDAWRRPF
jgi:hypothetical protein